MAEETTTTEGTEATGNTENTESTEAGGQEGQQEEAQPTLRERISSMFGGRPVRSAQLRHEEAAATEEAAAAAAKDASLAAEEDEDGEGGEGGEDSESTESTATPSGKRNRSRSAKIRDLRGDVSNRDMTIARLEGRLEALEKPGAPDAASEEAGKAVEAAKAAAEPEPLEESFDTDREYLKAVARWEVREEMRVQETARAEEKVNLTREEERNKVESNWADQQAKGRERYEDFDSVALSSEVPLSQAMVEQVARSEIGADLAYWLGRNLSEAARIATLEPPGAISALAVLEADIKSGRIAIPKNKQVGAPGEEKTVELNADESAATNAGEPAGGADTVAAAGAEGTAQPRSRTHAATPLKSVKGGERPEPDLAELAKSNPAEFMRIREKQRADYLRTKSS